MSVVFSGTFQGRFTSTGVDVFIPLPSGCDRMEVFNETVLYAAGGGNGAQFSWQLGDTNGRGTLYTKEATIGALVPSQIAVNAGFFVQDTTVNTPGALNNGSTGITAISNATPGVVTTGATAGMSTGNIVRLYNIAGGTQLNGYDFSVTVINGTTFSLTNMPPIVAATTGSFRVIPFNPYFYPSYRLITAVTQAANAIVTFSVTHSYLVGQKVRFIVPTVDSTHFGMTQLDGVEATIVAINQADTNGYTNTITVDVDTSGFTAFAFPLTGSGSFSPAMVVPVGENTATALTLNGNILGDAVINQGQRGMLLKAGAASPAGANGNVITWIAYKSFNV